ncbi:hypothetical protein A2223_04845 [Candidatus Falkowbacteria bacterium RIFOXYA2_FULL_35_8]|nr:MAG: hypothetical protein A2223_04845 [Candidatus Falkowbacteria bacterium RIFOXYA2_FULL_35_8]
MDGKCVENVITKKAIKRNALVAIKSDQSDIVTQKICHIAIPVINGYLYLKTTANVVFAGTKEG